MKVSVDPLMMHIVTTRGGDKPNHWVTMKLKLSIKLKWPTIDGLYRKAVSDGSQSNIAKEDTLKLMEGTNRRLKNKMNRYLLASWADENKWAFTKQRPGLVPRDWEDCHYWIRVFELLVRLNDLLVEQEALTQQLKKEPLGLTKADVKDTIANALNKETPN
ncbi:hypothetical protein PS15m_000760 [Mucor circinelloides]